MRAGMPALAFLFALGAAAQGQSVTCGSAQQPWMVAELLFGRAGVTEWSWNKFVAQELTPRFPDGLTIYDGRGQWRDPAAGRIVRERSKIVLIAMPPDAANSAKIQQIAAAYRSRFKQQSVGVIVRPGCVSF